MSPGCMNFCRFYFGTLDMGYLLIFLFSSRIKCFSFSENFAVNLNPVKVVARAFE